jgi:hypothetical protein
MTLKQNLAGVYTTLAPAVGFPSFLQSGIDVATGKRGLEQGLTAAFELPVRYSGGTYSTTQKQGKEITGVTGKELYEQNKQLSGQTKFSEKQMEALKSGQIKISDILDNRANKKEKVVQKPKLKLGKKKSKGTKSRKPKKITVKKVTVPKFRITAPKFRTIAPKTANIKIKSPPKPKSIKIGKNKLVVLRKVYKIKKPKKIKLTVSKKGSIV